jgi:hypothetical protein
MSILLLYVTLREKALEHEKVRAGPRKILLTLSIIQGCVIVNENAMSAAFWL